jgi:protein phosphatase
MDFFAISHKGSYRKRNEDRFLAKKISNGSLLLAVADGMGGEAGGELAAQIVVDTLAQYNPNAGQPEGELSRLIERAGEIILQEVEKKPEFKGMGTTAVAALILGTTVHWINVGDSRLYLFRDGILTQISKDHSFLQSFLDQGEMTLEELRSHPLRNVLDQCVGCPDCNPDKNSFHLKHGDILLLSSDGLHKYVSSGQITEVLKSQSTLEDKARALLELALATGGRDNITIVLATV